MVGLEHPILTPRLRLEPVTAALAEAARAGRAAFADVIGAEAPDEWCASNLQLVARSVSDLWGAAPTRVIAIHHEDWEVVGDVRFEPLLSAEGAPTGDFEIGYSIAAQRRRQGYATEAAGAVIDWLFDEYGAQTIVAGCDSRNLASVRTLRKLGFWLDSTPGRTFWWLITPKLRSATRA